MNVFDFLNKEDYQNIKNSVEKQENFDYEKEIKKIRLRLHNFYATHSWNEEVKEGDYRISIGYGTPTCGGSSPMSISEFMQYFETYETAAKYIDGFIGRLEKYGYETLENAVEQMTFF